MEHELPLETVMNTSFISKLVFVYGPGFLIAILALYWAFRLINQFVTFTNQRLVTVIENNTVAMAAMKEKFIEKELQLDELKHINLRILNTVEKMLETAVSNTPRRPVSIRVGNGTNGEEPSSDPFANPGN